MDYEFGNAVRQKMFSDIFGYSLADYRKICSGTPVDLYLPKNTSKKNIRFKFVVAGFDREEVEVYVEEDLVKNKYLIIKATKDKNSIKEEDGEELLIDSRIKMIENQRFLIPFNSDTDKIKISMDKGILEVFIPVKEEDRKKLVIG